MPRPAIGICAATEPARWAAWHEVATLLTRSYADAVQRAGGLALLLPLDPMSAESPDDILDHFDALILAGGVDIDPRSYGSQPHPEVNPTRPERDEAEMALARRAVERDLPLLGICRGMQLLNVSRGGTLVQHLPAGRTDDRHLPVPGTFAEHIVRLEPGSLAARAAGAERITVKTHHHQGVDDLGEGLVASGWSAADGIVEAIELPGGAFVLGVLWHPEEDPGSRVIPSLVERLVAAER